MVAKLNLKMIRRVTQLYRDGAELGYTTTGRKTTAPKPANQPAAT